MTTEQNLSIDNIIIKYVLVGKRVEGHVTYRKVASYSVGATGKRNPEHDFEKTHS